MFAYWTSSFARAVGGRERTESAELFFVRLNVSRTLIRKISPSVWVDNHAYVQGQSTGANFIVITGSFIVFWSSEIRESTY